MKLSRLRDRLLWLLAPVLPGYMRVRLGRGSPMLFEGQQIIVNWSDTRYFGELSTGEVLRDRVRWAADCKREQEE